MSISRSDVIKLIAGTSGPVTLDGADLSGADLSGLDLSRCSFKGANLNRASLKGANVGNLLGDLGSIRMDPDGQVYASGSGANAIDRFANADFTGADLTGVIGNGTKAIRSTLSAVAKVDDQTVFVDEKSRAAELRSKVAELDPIEYRRQCEQAIEAKRKGYVTPEAIAQRQADEQAASEERMAEATERRKAAEAERDRQLRASQRMAGKAILRQAKEVARGAAPISDYAKQF